MKRWTVLALILAGFALCSCEPERIISIQSETDFGECQGYCHTVLVITNQEVFLTEISTKGGGPDRIVKRPTKREEWARLTQSVPWREFLDLPDVIGNPDNVDQGSELLKITTDRRVKASDFDYGYDVRGLGNYLKLVRSIRTEMESKLPPANDSDGTVTTKNS